MASSPSAAEKQPLAFIDLAAQRARIGAAIDQAIARVVEHGQYILGPEVAVLEKAMSQFCGAKHTVTCANGTDALVLVMMAEDIGAGDAVFVPSFTFIATAEAVAARGGTPVFVDVDPKTFNIDIASLERSITSVAAAGELTPRMIVAVDLFGRPANYPALRECAERHGLVLVADAAQSFGAKLAGEPVGTLADFTTVSFFPSKPLGCYGDGGAVLTDDNDAADLLRSLRMHGKGTDKYDNVRIGLNSRLDTLQAAVLFEKLRILEEETVARNEAARRYNDLLAGVVETPVIDNAFTSVWAQYTVILPAATDRNKVQDACKAEGVPTAVYYPVPMDAQTGYKHYPRDPQGLPKSEMLSRRVLSLPMHAYLDATTQERVASTLRRALAA
jgi:dTDP-4-amino-4,6-dideoxygalactose transaminase